MDTEEVKRCKDCGRVLAIANTVRCASCHETYEIVKQLELDREMRRIANGL